MKLTLLKALPVLTAGLATLATLATVALASAAGMPASRYRYVAVQQAAPVSHAGHGAQTAPSVHAGHIQQPVRASTEGLTTARDVTPLIGTLGSHSHPITTTSPLAQRYFDEGLTLTFGFNHAEAVRSFKDAAELDPACAMCHWGIALALGPNINAPMDDAAVPEAFAALQQAQVLAATARARPSRATSERSRRATSPSRSPTVPPWIWRTRMPCAS
jgi:hypothetical protein